MANYLLRSLAAYANSNTRISLPVPVNPSGNFTVKFKCKMGDGATSWVPISNGIGGTDLIFFTSTTNIQLRRSSVQLNFTLPKNAGSNVCIYEFIGSLTNNNISVYQDGVLLGTAPGATLWSISILYGLANSSRFGDLYYLEISDVTGGFRNYDPSASNGTGLVLIDTASGQNGSLVGNWPANNSHWVLDESGEPPGEEQNQSGTGSTTIRVGGLAAGSFVNEQNQAGSGASSVAVSGEAIGSFINAQEQAGSGAVKSSVGGSAVGSYINEQHQSGSGVVTSRVSGAVIGSFVNNTGSEQHYAGTGTVTTRVGGVAIGSFINEQNFAGTGQGSVTVSGEVVGSYANIQRQAGSGTVTVRVTGTVIGSFINEVAPAPEPELGWGDPVSLFAEALPIEQISLTFDQLGRPLVFYRTGADALKLYWYDPVLQESVNVQIATGTDPQAGFDFPQDTGQSFTDALLFYVRNDTVYMRVQRDRFAIEYPCPANKPGLRLTSNGLRVDNRYQVVYQYQDDGYTPPVVPVPEIPVIGTHAYLQSGYDTGIITDYNIPAVLPDESFEIGMQVSMFSTTRGRGLASEISAGGGFSGYSVPQTLFHISTGLQSSGLLSREWYAELSLEFTSSADTLKLVVQRQIHYVRTSVAIKDYSQASLRFVFGSRIVGANSKRELTIYLTGKHQQSGIEYPEQIIFSGQVPAGIAEYDFNGPTRNLVFGGKFGYDRNNNKAAGQSLYGIIQDCYAKHNGNTVSWPIATNGQATQPSEPTGNPATIFNHRPQNWRFIQP